MFFGLTGINIMILIYGFGFNDLSRESITSFVGFKKS